MKRSISSVNEQIAVKTVDNMGIGVAPRPERCFCLPCVRYPQAVTRKSRPQNRDAG